MHQPNKTNNEKRVTAPVNLTFNLKTGVGGKQSLQTSNEKFGDQNHLGGTCKPRTTVCLAGKTQSNQENTQKTAANAGNATFFSKGRQLFNLWFCLPLPYYFPILISDKWYTSYETIFLLGEWENKKRKNIRSSSFYERALRHIISSPSLPFFALAEFLCKGGLG